MVASQTLYRKWRSQTFGDIVGQRHVTRTLLNALETGRVSHAYLFCGPRGVGKTSIARLLAKAINCQTNGRGEPCNTCDMCQMISEGRALDVIEIDAASNRGIDEIRDLRDKVNFAPNEGRFKFYILDEAHMLTNEAANALLKTLEEPPGHVVFVLVTTEPHKLPATILSRCQRFDFRRVPLRDIMERLNYICDQEGVKADAGAIEVVARTATGSLRDAVSLLDQLVAYCGRDISLDDAEAVLGISGSAAARQLVDLVLQHDLAAAIRLVNDVMVDGGDPRQFNRQIVEHLRGIMLLKVSGDSSGILDVAPEVLHQMAAQAALVSPEQLVRLIRCFGQADLGLRTPAPLQLPLELAVVEATLSLGEESTRDEAPTPPRPAIAAKTAERDDLQSSRSTIESQPAIAPGVTPGGRRRRSLLTEGQMPTPSGGGIQRAPVPEPRPLEDSALDRWSPQEKAAPPEIEHEHQHESGSTPDNTPNKPAAESAVTEQPQTQSTSLNIEQLIAQWPKVIRAIGDQDKKIQALLRDAEPGDVVGDRIQLNFAHAFHKETIEKEANLALVEKTFDRLLGGRWHVQCVVGQVQKRVKKRLPVDDPLVKEVIARGARIKSVHTSSEGEYSDA